MHRCRRPAGRHASIGKTPLSVISPKKTYEGAIGGIVVSMLVGMILLGLFRSHAPEGFNLFLAAIIAIPISVASIASDLVESAFKRQAEVKDSGNIIPGIGGIFDLSDSLILTAPLGYLLFKYTLFSKPHDRFSAQEARPPRRDRIDRWQHAACASPTP